MIPSISWSLKLITVLSSPSSPLIGVTTISNGKPPTRFPFSFTILIFKSSKIEVALIVIVISPTTSVAESTKSNTHEWSLLAAIGVLLYALSNAIVGVASMGGYYPFLPMLGIGILVGAAAYGLTALGVWVLVAKIFKKQASFIQALNVSAVALLPLAAIQVVNILVGLIYSPLVTAFTVSALIMSAMLLYIGIQKFDKLEKSPFYAYSIMAAAVVVSVSIVSILYDVVFQGAMTVGNIIGSLF